ncbi:MAG: hypothetical protein ACYTG4_16660, partial [Planctomycetota bacterium]
STLGALYTGREGTGYHNRVVGVDGLIRPADPVSVLFQHLRSSTSYPEAFASAQGQPEGSLSGQATMIQANYESRGWRWQGMARDLDPTFRADAGFVPQVDVREVNVWAQRLFWGGQHTWFSRINLTSGFWTHWRSDGLRTERVWWGNVLYMGPGMLRVFADYQRRAEYFEGSTYDLDRYRVEVNAAPSRSVGFGLGFRTGDAIDLA